MSKTTKKNTSANFLQSCKDVKSYLELLRSYGIMCRWNGYNLWTKGVGKNDTLAQVCIALGMHWNEKRQSWYIRHNRKNNRMWVSCIGDFC